MKLKMLVKKLICLVLVSIFLLAGSVTMSAQGTERFALWDDVGDGHPLRFYFDSEPISATVVPHPVLDMVDVFTVSVGTTIFGEVVAQNLPDDAWIWNEWITLSELSMEWHMSQTDRPQWDIINRRNASFTFDTVGRFIIVAEAQTAIFEIEVVPGQAPTPQPIPQPSVAQPISVYLDGVLLSMDVPPQLVDGRTLVPLRAIFEALGAEVDWNPETQTVIGTRENTVVILTIGSTTPTVNGQIVPIDVPAQLVDGRTLVPLRFVAESFGVEVNWDGSTRTVTITT